MARTRLGLVQSRIAAWNRQHPEAPLDARAVLAVTSHEGLGGGIGDGGHAFGFAQLNDAGGVITGKFPGWTPDQIQQWAWSKQGIDFAISHMARVAGGLTGAHAVHAIVGDTQIGGKYTGFERPANEGAEISRSLASYGLPVGADGPIPGGGSTSAPVTQAPPASSQSADTTPLALALLAAQPPPFRPPAAPQGTLQVPMVHVDAPQGIQSPLAPEAIKLGLLHAADSAGGFTTPGFASWLHAADGLHLPSDFQSQLSAGREQTAPTPQPRDLLFFGSGTPTHSGLSLGSDQFLHGTNNGRTIQLSSLSDPRYAPHLLSVRNVMG